MLRCGALMRPRCDAEAEAVAALKANADRNGVAATLREDEALEIPGESVTDPVAYTLSLAAAAREHGAQWLPRFRVTAIESGDDSLLAATRSGGRTPTAGIAPRQLRGPRWRRPRAARRR